MQRRHLDGGRGHTRGRPVARAAGALLLLGGLLVPAGAGTALADTVPVDPAMPATVAADVLPTPQINGVAWTQAVIGDRVYVGGDFTSTRPFGASAGTGEVRRSNMLAYSVSTGALITSFAPEVNGQVLALRASPDGKTLYAGGSFTAIGGQTRSRVAAFDAVTGALLSGFRPVAGSTVRAIAATSSTVYLGGDFQSMADQPGGASKARARLAAIDAASGAVLGWNPGADGAVRALTVNRDDSLVVAGGHFGVVAGEQHLGLVALGATSGRPVPWLANASIRDYGTNAAINSLSTDAKGILITGYTFNGGGNFESVARLDDQTGEVLWISDCRGDTHSAYAQADVVYTVGHPHRCSDVPGGFEERWPRYSPGSATFTDFQAGVLLPDVHGWYDRTGQPAPAMLAFHPRWYFGTYTPSDQGAWHVTGNDKYVVFGGEFIGLNGLRQQGLTRMARPEIAPKRSRPIAAAELQPTVVSYAPGQAHVGWQETSDYDNEHLDYRVYRGASGVSDVLVASVPGDSAWHQRSGLSYIDTGLTEGRTYNYYVTARDPHGNTRTSARTSVTITSGAIAQAYGQAVLQDSPEHYYRFSGQAAALTDIGSSDTATSFAGVSLASGNPIGDAGNSVGTLDGSTTAYSAARIQSRPPQQVTVEAWVKSTDGSGGRIVGYSTHYEGNSTWADRHLYLDTDGRIRFGVDANGTAKTTIASTTGYDDGKWHHVAGTLSAEGMKLYVDGRLAATNPSVTAGRRMTGSWRIGKDSLGGWPSAPTDGQLSAQIDEVAVYPYALSAQQVAAHVAAATGAPAPQNSSPTASFTTAVSGSTVNVDATGSLDEDGTIVSYEWEFGDGSTGSGGVAEHTYGADGSYPVTVTVTDDDGATGQATRTVSIGQPAVLASDSFERSVTAGWAVADVGGSWSSCSRCSVAGGYGVMTVRAGDDPVTSLPAVVADSADMTAEVRIDRLPTGSGAYIGLYPRGQGRDGYRARLLISPTGAVTATLQRVIGSASVSLASATVSGLTVEVDTPLAIRVQAVGIAPTSLRVRVWVAGQPEPVAWTVVTSDADASWQRTGSPGLWSYLPSTATNGPVTVRWDNVLVAAG